MSKLAVSEADSNITVSHSSPLLPVSPSPSHLPSPSSTPSAYIHPRPPPPLLSTSLQLQLLHRGQHVFQGRVGVGVVGVGSVQEHVEGRLAAGLRPLVPRPEPRRPVAVVLHEVEEVVLQHQLGIVAEPLWGSSAGCVEPIQPWAMCCVCLTIYCWTAAVGFSLRKPFYTYCMVAWMAKRYLFAYVKSENIFIWYSVRR